MSDIIRDNLSDQLEKWAEDFLMSRATYLMRKKIEASGELIDSLEYDLDKTATDDAIRMLIAFNEYGRYIDMKNVTHDKWGRNAIERVEDWIRDKGLLQKWIPKFMEKYNRKTIPSDILNRMAWGVLRNQTYAWKPKKWYNKSKQAAINDLYNDVAASMLDNAGEVIEKEMTDQEYKKIRAKFIKYAKAKGRL